MTKRSRVHQRGWSFVCEYRLQNPGSTGKGRGGGEKGERGKGGVTVAREGGGREEGGGVN